MSVQLAPSPVFQGLGFGGVPLPGGQLFTYLAGTSTPQATYVDSTQTTPNANPVILNANAQANVWLVVGQTYKLVLQDAFGNQIWSVDQIPGGQLLTQASIGSILWPRSPSEITASVTPTNFGFPWGDVRRYGADPTGGADSTVAFNNALISNGRVYAPYTGGSYLIAGQITLQNGNILYGDGSASIINFSATTNADFILGSNITSATVTDLKLVAVGVTTSNNYQGVLAYRGCTNCRAERLEIVGFYADAINLTASVDCIVEDNYIHGVQGTLGSQHDIHVNSTTTASSLNNIISNNRCFGGGDFGIGLFQTNLTGFPIQKCIVTGNRIGQHLAYGILIYDAVLTGVNTWNQVIGNYIENIQGSSGGNSNYGAGIYVANHGGCTVSNNTISNCCVTTASGLLTPGGIGINSQAQLAATTITGNAIFDMAQGNASGINIAGIFCVNLGNGSTISGNTISQQISGGIQAGIFIQAPSSDVQIVGNNINILNTIANVRGIFCYANGANLVNFTIQGNNVIGTSVAGMELFNNGAFTITNITVGGNTISGGSSASIGMLVGAFVQASVTGNNVSCTTAIAFDVAAACTQTRVSNNTFITTGTVAVATGGTCTGSMLDESNYLSSSAGTQLNAVNNAGTLFNIRQLGTIAPTAGTQILGDTVYSTTGMSPFALWCTNAGTPGTFTGLTIP